MPEWLKLKTPAPSLQTLQFESDPPGADVRTAQGQACRTPCSLAVPLAPQTVTFAMIGFLPKTVPIQVEQTGERSEVTYEVDPPKFAPNPVEVALQPALPPPRMPPPKKPHKVVAKHKTIARPRVQPVSAQPFPTPPPVQTQSGPSPFPPPPIFAPPQAR
jgi:hypothetical protein